MEFEELTREIRIDAAPEIVFEVVSRPEHIKKWWSDDASFEPVPGAVGELMWGDHATEAITVIDVDPPRRFAFRWIASDGRPAKAENSLLVAFELEPADDGGTLLRFTESDWRKKDWDRAVLEETFRDHERGWELFLSRLQSYAPSALAR